MTVGLSIIKRPPSPPSDQELAFEFEGCVKPRVDVVVLETVPNLLFRPSPL